MRNAASGLVCFQWIGDEDAGDLPAVGSRGYDGPGELLGSRSARRDPYQRGVRAHRVGHLRRPAVHDRDYHYQSGALP